MYINHLNGLSNVTQINGSIWIQNNTFLQNINGLSNVTQIHGDLVITNNVDMWFYSISFPYLSLGVKYVTIKNNPNLHQLNLPQLNITDSFIISVSGNTLMCSLVSKNLLISSKLQPLIDCCGNNVTRDNIEFCDNAVNCSSDCSNCKSGYYSYECLECKCGYGAICYDGKSGNGFCTAPPTSLSITVIVVIIVSGLILILIIAILIWKFRKPKNVK